jgi:putative transcriptional regulator
VGRSQPESGTADYLLLTRPPGRARETGLHRNTVPLLYKETATQVELETIDRLCRYFQCGVADLFEHLPVTVVQTERGRT